MNNFKIALITMTILSSAAIASKASAQANRVLWFNTPAKPGMTEALPIGNGRIGALVYGGEAERLVLNDSSLWTGDENPSGDYKSMGSYQMLGELLLTPVTPGISSASAVTAPRFTVTSGQKAYFPSQEVFAATDGDPKTKWCVEHGGKPLVWLAELPKPKVVSEYGFTSAEDVPGRDPSTWEMAGSQDGKTWTPLDRQANHPPMAKRGETNRYRFANTTAYRYYRLTLQPNVGLPHLQVAEIVLGGVPTIPIRPALATSPQFRRQLDIETATAVTEYVKDGVRFKREVFASQPADVMVVRWSADKPGALNGTIELKGAHNESTTANGAQLSFSGKFNNGIHYVTEARILPQGSGTVAIKDGKVQLKNLTSVVIVVGAGTNYVYDAAKRYAGTDPTPRIAQQVDLAAKKPFETLKAEHITQYQKVFHRANIDLGTTPSDRAALPTDKRMAAQSALGGDPDFEELQFQYGRYLLISCSRPGAVPANLQGMWNDSNSPPWYSDYHTNINIQMNYWPAEVTNLSEYQTPLIDLVKSQIPAWRKATAASPEYKTPGKTLRGFAVRTSHNITGGMGWRWDKTANAWYCQHFWEHYAFTGDKKFLRSTAYPILKETCDFWEDQLKTLPDGRLAVPHGWSPEHGPDEDGVSYNQQIVWDLFNNTVQASTELGIDSDYRARITAIRDKLVGPKIGSWGQLQEWMTDRDDPKDQHRHTSHLFGVFPGRQISAANTPEFARAAKVSLDARTNAPGGDVNEWACAWRAAIYARLHDGENAHTLLRRFSSLACPNLFGLLPGIPQIDGSFGVTAAMAEMLLQSHEDEINLLPALPSAWRTGSFQGLRARGGITVDAAWKNGTLIEATLRSDRDHSVRVRSGNTIRKISLRKGQVIRIGPEMTGVNPDRVAGKEVYLPADGKDYSGNDSEYSNKRRIESDNFVLFWSKEYGDAPASNPNLAKRFDADAVLKECERFYTAYVSDLKFVQKGNSVTDKYKTVIYVIGGAGANATGFGADNTVGIMWVPAVRINKGPYGVIAHELGHSFQYLVHADGNWGFYVNMGRNSIWEMTSQYMLWQVYPEWMTFENYHLTAFMKRTHLAFLHEDNYYHSPFVLEYWSNKHGVDFLGKLWREAKQGEDAVMTYQRITGIDQATFNDEIFDVSRHFITWDMPRIEKVTSKYANQHISTLNSIGDGWYRIAASHCPQNYGYNGIKLKVPTANTEVTLDFKGIAGSEGFRAINVESGVGVTAS
jgi:alpha-L-fucosidase 2